MALTGTSVVLAATPAGTARAFESPTSTVFINEIHYDNDGTDTGEFVEIAGPAGTDLSGWSIVRYNGSTGAAYTSPAAPGISPTVIPDQGGGHGTATVSYPQDGLQNGAPDAIALVNGTTLIQFLSYEGSFVGVGGMADGVTSTNLPSGETSATAAGFSLHLTGTGSTYGDFTWTGPAAATPGAINTGQSLGDAPLAAVDPGDKSFTVGTPTAAITLNATGGTAPYAFVVDQLPDGLSISGNTISGTPSAVGTTTVTITVTDSAEPQATATAAFDIAVVAAPLVAGEVTDQTSTVGTAITPIVLTATGGTSPYTFAASGLPSGVTLTGDTISGTPTVAGTFPVTITVADADATSTDTFTITVVPSELQATDPGDFTFTTDSAIVPIVLGATGGASPYTFAADQLPAGLALSGGSITGTPTAAGTTTVTVTVSDSADPVDTATATFDITITDPPPHPFISEFHYDNAGTDTGEFVEITGVAGTDFSQYQIVLYNGSNNQTYGTYALSGIATDQDDGFGATVRAVVLQNGSPDAVALVTVGGELVEFLSYEGVLTAANGPVTGVTSVDVGVSEPDNTPTGQTLLKQEDGAWGGPSISNEGLPNGYSGWTPPLVALDTFDRTFVVGAEVTPFDLTATGGEPPYTFSATGLPAGLSLTGATISGTPTAAGVSPVEFTVTDSDDPSDSDTETFDVTVVAAPTEVTPIAGIQGTGAVSPVNGSVVTTEGVVTALYETGGYDGFYIQTGGTGGTTEATPGASDAIFVYAYSSFGGSPDAAALDLGDSVSVTGSVSEYFETTEITLLDLEELETPLAPVTPLSLPWTNFDAVEEKEAHEGELLAPAGDFTVTNAYAASGYGEIGLAAGTSPLIQPTEVADAQDTAAIAAVVADNAARAITLDDGGSTNYSANPHLPLSWFGADSPPRVSAAVTFTGNVILEYRNNLWKFQPTTPVREATADGTGTATFEATRTLEPGEVGGDIRLATFNVLNLFPTTGEEYENELGGSCSSYNDRLGNPITVNDCGASGPRGAWDDENLARQTAKIVLAINSLDASIVSLEELENSVRFGKDRDFAISYLVDELNAAAGPGTWAYAPSPAPADRPAPANEDVIRNGFIYKPDDVSLVGESVILIDETAFGNAREPLAQAFKAVGAPDSEAFVAIVNHFKSKGSGIDDGTGQGNANPDRINQATALIGFADDVAAAVGGSGAVFLLGDFNSYTMEDPMQILYGAGYDKVDSTVEPGEASYSFQGLSGSLDHVLANDVAAAIVTGADIWNINGEESVMFQYSRYNYNITNLWDPTAPFAASDHNPETVGIDLSGPVPTVSYTGDDPTAATELAFTVQFDAPAIGFDDPATDATLTGSATAAVTAITAVDATTYTVDVTVTADGTVVLEVPAGAATDAIGRPSAAAAGAPVTVDTAGPAVTVEKAIGQKDPAPAKQDVRFTVTFSEAVTGFGVDDLVYTGGGVAPVITGSGSVYTVTFNAVKRQGTLTLSVREGAVVDSDGNRSSASTSSDNSVEIVAPGTGKK